MALPMMTQKMVREQAKSQGMRVAPDFIAHLRDDIKIMVTRSIVRARENGRSTLSARDA